MNRLLYSFTVNVFQLIFDEESICLCSGNEKIIIMPPKCDFYSSLSCLFTPNGFEMVQFTVQMWYILSWFTKFMLPEYYHCYQSW